MASKQQPEYDPLKGWIMVILQFVALGILLGWPPRVPQSLTGITLFCAGLLMLVYAVFSMNRKSWSAHPQPTVAGVFTQKGPYKIIRHPMYTGVLLAASGMLADNPTTGSFFAFVLLFFVFYLKITLEEKMLCSRFPDYKAYQCKTKRLIPGLW